MAKRSGPGSLAFAILAILLAPEIFAQISPGSGSLESRLTRAEMKRFASAKKIEDIFRLESKIQLATSRDNAIADITDLEVDSEGRVFVADGWRRKTVFVFAADGRFIRELAKQGQGPGEYQTPVSLAIGARDDIWVADYMGNKILIFDRELRFQRAIAGQGKLPHFIHVTERGDIYMYSGAVPPVPRPAYDTIQKYDPGGNKLISFAPLPEEILKLKFSAVQDGMTIGRDGSIFEMNPMLYRIRKYSPDGKLVKTFSRKTNLFSLPQRSGDEPTIVNGPFYLEKGLILAQVSGHLEIYDTDGGFLAGAIPFSDRIRAVRGKRLYVVRWEDRAGTEEQPNPMILCYVLKTS